ncbi:MAG: V-type ATP synthase subunit F [archaeon]|nr:V-type ATP synthase subunit F [archaeon]
MTAEKQNIVVIGDAETCTGFRLAGVREAYPLEGREAEKKLSEIIGEQKAGIVIINERLVQELDFRLGKSIERIAKPVVIAVPDKRGPSSEAESLKALIARALGFELIK